MERKRYVIEADKNRELKFNYRALLELEKNGIDVFALHKHRRLDDLLYMYQMGFLHEEELDRNKMMVIMDKILEHYNIGDVVRIVIDAIIESLKGEDTDEEDVETESDGEPVGK